MGFWIAASIVLFIVVVLSAFGPMVGLYGDMKYKGRENKQ